MILILLGLKIIDSHDVMGEKSSELSSSETLRFRTRDDKQCFLFHTLESVHLNIQYCYCPQTKLREGSVFTCSLSLYGRSAFPQCHGAGRPPSPHKADTK